jgi:hypothetical protein
MVHFRLDEGGRVYAACHPYISAPSYRGKRLVVHAVLVTCPVCKELIAPARAQKEKQDVKSGVQPPPIGPLPRSGHFL